MNLNSIFSKYTSRDKLRSPMVDFQESSNPNCRPTHIGTNTINDDPTVIEAQNLSLFYQNHQALHNVTTTIPRNQVTAIVGPSGCGKTSFLLTLNKIYEINKKIRVTGSLKFNNQNILEARFDSRTHRKNVGMLFQKPNAFPLSIIRNMELPLLEHGIVQKKDVEGYSEVLFRKVGLWNEVKDRLHKSAQELSGGQQQRLCLARALSLNPQVLLMDEPCSALDPHSTALIEELIKQLRTQISIVIVTHNLAQARRVSDQTMVFWSNESSVGELVEYGTTENIFTNAQTNEAKAYIQGLRG